MKELCTFLDQRLDNMMRIVDSVANQILYVGDVIQDLTQGQRQLERRMREGGHIPLFPHGSPPEAKPQ